MKKITTFSKLLLLVTLLFTAVACNSGNGNANTNQTNSSDGTKTTQTTQITNIAFVRVDSVIQNYDMYHELKAEFEQKAKKLEADFATKVRTLEQDMAKFNEEYEKMLITRSQAEERAQKLQLRQQELRDETGPMMRAELAEEENVMLRRINDALLKYIEKYNEDKQYSLILNSATILTGNPAMDITSDILKGLNEEYIAGKAKK